MVADVQPKGVSPDYTVKEAARYLRKSTKTIYKWVKTGVLPASTVSREKMISAHAVETLYSSTRQ